MKRNYSISCVPNGDQYRISVKREANGMGGSRFLHDHAGVGDVFRRRRRVAIFSCRTRRSGLLCYYLAASA